MNCIIYVSIYHVRLENLKIPLKGSLCKFVYILDRGIDSFEIQIVKISADETDCFYFLAQTLHCMKNTLHFGYKSGFRPIKLLEPSSNSRKLTDRLLFQSRGLSFIRK